MPLLGKITDFNMMKRSFLLLICWGFLSQLMAQEKYWVFFEEKEICANQAPSLGPKALERRARQEIGWDEKDYPLSPAFLEEFRSLHLPILQQSRWLNAISVRLNEQQKDKVGALPFVKKIAPVAVMTTAAAHSCNPQADYDSYRAQLSQVGLDDLHAQGFRGKGIRIAVMDNGFAGMDTIPAFRHIWERAGLVYEEDLVEKGTSLYGDCQGSCTHGSRVMSVLAARWSGHIIGAAPEADFMLFRTENDLSETHQEEDNWLAAAEKADSLGADIILSALTYKTFDPGEGDYPFSAIDGQTAIVTLAAEIAAQKGILVVNSAGNYGARGIAPPADGPSVLAIGSVTQEGVLSSFSGRGPTFDGRIKPDLVARGDQNFLLYSNGQVNRGSGTSYAAPLVAGLAACLWQADDREHTAAELRSILRQSGDSYQNPDNNRGYGLPSAAFCFQKLTNTELNCVPNASLWGEEIALIYPNPTYETCYLALSGLAEGQKLVIEILDGTGRKILERKHVFGTETEVIAFQTHWNPGYYLIRVRTEQGGFLFSDKIVLNAK